MLTFPDFSPDIISIGPITLRWYGMMYLLGFFSFWLLGKSRLSKFGFTSAQFDSMLSWGILGVILGGRLGYVLFYNPSYFLHNPEHIFAIWEGGMSFHGGLLGVLIVAWLLAKSFKVPFFQLMDFVAPLVPPGLFFGRLGNFINAELWGKVTTAPWGMVFPGAGPYPRHPSQLYEAFLEGVVLFAALWVFSSKKRPCRAISGFFALGYGLFRFIVEFVREPDAHLNYLWGGFLTMGMLLSLPLMFIGAYLLINAYYHQDNCQ